MEQSRRSAIIELRRSGHSPADITRLTKYPRRTVYDVVAAFDRDGKTTRAEHKTRCDKLRTRRFMAGLKRTLKANPTVKISKLAKDRNVSQTTIKRAIREDLGLKSKAGGGQNKAERVIRGLAQPKKMSSSSSPYALAALKTKGIEKSVWVEFIQLALEVKPLNLGQGFPDFAAPDTVRNALAECCLDNENVLYNQYTRGFGHPRLINAISKLYSKVLGRTLDPLNEVLVTAGAYEGLFVAINGLVNPGDEVIIIEPFFDCYEPQTKLAGGTPIFVPLRPTKTEGEVSSADWKFDPDELSKAFSSRTKAIVVNTPNNPLGKVFNLEELTMIADLCKKHNAFAIMDEVYEWMTYDDSKHIRMATLPGMWERCLTIGSAGKTFSVTGWKTGWVIGPKEVLAGPKVVHQHSVYTCSTPIQEAVARGFEIEIERLGTPECYFQSLPAELSEKKKKIVDILSKAGFNPIVPEGGYFILADVRELMKKIDVGGDPSEPRDFRFVKWLSRNRKLQGIPPSAFFSGPHKYIGEDYIRFCFIKEDKNLEKAGEILSQLKKDIDAGKI